MSPRVESSEQHRWLIAAFTDESDARRAAEDAETSGTDLRDIRIGNSLDALASIEAEMETRHSTPRMGIVVGAVIGWFLGSAFRTKHPSEPRAAVSGTMLALPDTEPARRALLDADPKRVDVFGAGGFLLGTLPTRDPDGSGSDRPRLP